MVRRRLPDTPGHLTDVIGHVVSLDPLVVRPQSVGGFVSDAETVEIPAELIQVVKVLPPRRVRNSEIRAVEIATAAAFPGIEHVEIDGWLLRAGDGITERSNSAAPLGASAGFSPVPIAAIQDFYQRHGLPPSILVPDRIAPTALQFARASGWSFGPEIVVMTRSLQPAPSFSPPAGFHFEVLDAPTPDWLDLYHFRGQPLPEHALRLLQQEIEGHLGFGAIRSDSGEIVAITRATITAGGDEQYLGYSAVEVAAAYRRRGLASALGAAMLSWGAQMGATQAYLQVVATNEAGLGLYDKLGFTEHHRHRYAHSPQ
ncbi:N-acetylglutamate synthase, CG3035 family [Corynebacterium epidermidicanis]|uniref:N-acetylglutamate synthase, CG3035 family n=1 Tax=Corynebacterium epidermidicanis TaxID=1050174 RepID=UPI000640DE1F|nr:GNAT family N-acetyltransferase [Corynebacterium epidermidicanis]